MTAGVERLRNSLLAEASSGYVGLHEIAWDLATNARDVPAHERTAVARSLVRELLANHKGRLFRTAVWPPIEWQPVPEDEWDAVLNSDAAWVVVEASEPAVLYWITLED
jgi:hypothetical protein